MRGDEHRRLLVWLAAVAGFCVAAVCARLFEPSLVWLAIPYAAATWAKGAQS